MMVVAVDTEPDLTVSKPSLLFRGRFSMGPLRQTANYDVAPDGRFVMLREVVAGSSPDIIVVLNWFEELKRLVPTN